MAELKVSFIMENLRQIKKSLEEVKIGSRNDTGGSSGGKGKGGGKAGGFAFLGGLLGSILGQLESVTGFLGGISALINAFVAPFVPLLLGLLKPVFVGLNALLVPMLKFFNNNADLIGAVVGLTSTISLITGGVDGLKEKLGVIADKFGLDFNFSLSESWAALKDFLRRAWEGIGNTIYNTYSFITDMLRRAWESLRTRFINIWKSIVTFLRPVWENLKERFFSIWDALSKIFVNVVTFIGNLFNKLVQGFISIFNPVLKFFRNAFNQFAIAFVDGVNYLIRLINLVSPFRNVRTISTRDLGRSANTNISINIEGSADQSTVEAVVDKLRSELSRRGSF